MSADHPARGGRTPSTGVPRTRERACTVVAGEIEPLIHYPTPENDAEAAAFRAYLQKGGFVIFDDFAESRGGWAAFAAAFRQVLPGAQFFDLDPSHPIFHCFFEIDSFDIVPQMYDLGRPVFRGVFEDNDPAKRLLLVASYNHDLGELWEYSGTGFVPVDLTNDAYKYGVNYIVYAMTH